MIFGRITINFYKPKIVFYEFNSICRHSSAVGGW